MNTNHFLCDNLAAFHRATPFQAMLHASMNKNNAVLFDAKLKNCWSKISITLEY